MELNLDVDNYCFVCGTENPVGLKLKFESSGGGVVANFTPTKEHQGFVNLVHGGILSALMDEAMAHAVISRNLKAVTGKMEVTYKKPTRIGEPLTVQGRIVEKRGRIIKTASSILQNGIVTAEATAHFLLV